MFERETSAPVKDLSKVVNTNSKNVQGFKLKVKTEIKGVGKNTVKGVLAICMVDSTVNFQTKHH